MTYQAPLADMVFALKYGAALAPALEQGFFGDLTMDDVEAVLAEAGRVAGEIIAPLNRIGDRSGTMYSMGDRLKVRLMEAAPLTGGLRFELEEANAPQRSGATQRPRFTKISHAKRRRR